MVRASVLSHQKIPVELKNEYPFESHHHELKSGHLYHYIDEGPKDAPAILMVHGNPTWSFFYRNLIKSLSSSFRVIASDHIGCGLSDKPQEYNYTLSQHIQNLDSLIKNLDIKDFHLVVHDWGGAIGLGLAGRHPRREGKNIILNTAAFVDSKIPKRIELCRIPFLGEKLIRHFNAFAWPATFMAVEQALSPLIKKGYLYPYSDYQTRIATARFVQDIPMNQEHCSYQTLKEVEEGLSSIKGEKLILWGMKDFCFTPHFFERWKTIYPKAKSVAFPSAGHYLLEDEEEKVLEYIQEFLQ